VLVGVTVGVGEGVGVLVGSVDGGAQTGPASIPMAEDGPVLTPTRVVPTSRKPLTITVKGPCVKSPPTSHLMPVI
jgi:hypothetical protein